MAEPTTAQINTLVSYFLKLYAKVDGGKPSDFNRFRDKWAFKDMLQDYGMDGAKAIIDYYFETPRYTHPTKYLLYNYDALSNVMQEAAKDKVDLAKLRAESKIRTEEWRNRGK